MSPAPTTPAPILIGSEVTPKGSALALLGDASERTLKEGEVFTVAVLGGAFAVLTQSGTTTRFLVEVADLQAW